MRISELIAKLQEAMAEHGDLPVIVDGYEAGYHDAEVGGVLPVIRDVNTASYEGPHDWNTDGNPEAKPHLLIARG